jgi:integrase
VADGADPAAQKREKRQAATVAELCDLYLADAEAGSLLTHRGVAKKPSTLATDKSRIEHHIKPLLGTMKVSTVTRADVERFMHAVAEGETAQRVKLSKKRALSKVRGGKGAASRTVGLLGAIFTYAERKRMIAQNPVRGVIRYADGRRERRLSDEEYAALGRGLAKLAEPPPPRKDGKPAKATMGPAATAATRFLALTGWRSGEALTLRWGMVDLARRIARLPDTKTGESIRPLSAAACDVLRAQGPGAADALVFPPSRGDETMSGFRSLFARIVKAGGLPPDVTPHVLRHSFASLANDLGYSEATIGMLIGHKGTGSTTRAYIHHGDAPTAAADRIAATILRKMAGEGAADVVSAPPGSSPAR